VSISSDSYHFGHETGTVSPAMSTGTPDPGPSDGLIDTPSRPGRWIRLAATVAAAALLLVGTIWGQDDMFPFGPFRMYATADKLNAPVADTRFEIVDASGATVALTERNSGIRRAEIEGQLSRFQSDPSLLRVIDDAYVTRNPHAPTPVVVRIVIRWFDLRDGVETGTYHDVTVATWNPPGASE
jgi:hypothetical protein